MNFNASQLRAISVGDGPAMVLAGAGSGKTTVITHRILSLVQEKKINPSNILVITFTRAAANEMKERYEKIAPSADGRVTFGTFHSVFFMVLKLAYHMNASNILPEEKKYAMIRELIRKYRIDARDENDLCQSLLGEISLIKNSRIELDHFYSGACSDDIFRKIYTEYNDYLMKNRLLDYDDMLTYTYDLFSQRKDILKAWQNKFKYILIDEFQDINQIQFDIIRMLAEPENNLFIVGDDDQSIYRFRGSKPEIMLNFPKYYPDTQTILLDVNYRCDGTITEKAMKVIGCNHVRYEKKIQAEKPATDSLSIQLFSSQEQENLFLKDEILRLQEKGVMLDEIAILFRTNTGPRALMDTMLKFNIPVKSRDQIPNLFDHWAVKDIRTYIRLAQGSRRRSEFFQIMNRPLRYLSRDSLPEEEVAFDEWERIYSDKPWMEERVIKLEQDLKTIAKLSPYSAVNYIRKGVGYDEYIESICQERNLKKEDLFEVLDEFQATAKGFRTYREWNDHILECEENLQKLNQRKSTQKNAVTFSTLHSAKGLEFEHVYIIDVNEGNIPYKKAMLEEDIEEERRLFYVGMTRAKDHLTLCSVKNKYEKETKLSRFLLEIDPKADA